jgi:hypothetical protein
MKVTLRQKRFDNCVVETKSFFMGESWSNCIYLKFKKELFRDDVYPMLLFKEDGARGYFNYTNTIFSKIDCHSYLSFYEELTINRQSEWVILGWDFQHLYDDDYMLSDNGELIMQNYAEKLKSELDKLIKESK